MPTAESSRQLSAADAAFLYLERKEIPLHIAGVCIFDGEIPFAEFVHAVESRLHLLPRYRQVIDEAPLHLGYPIWKDDPHFNIHRHILHVRADPPGGRAELEALSSRILSQVMDRGKPLWDIHVVSGLESGRGAAIFRAHHSLADGVAGVSIMKVVFDASPNAPREVNKPPRYRPKPLTESDRSIPDALARALHSSLESLISAEAVLLDFSRTLADDHLRDSLQKLVGLLPELAASSDRFVFNRPCSGERKFCWTEFPLAEVQAIREQAGGTMNDVILTVLVRAVRRYVRAHGERVAGRFLRVVCPVNVRRDGGESLGNRISFLPVALPLGVAGPLRTLREVSARTEIMKNARAAHLVALVAAWLGAAPPPLQALFWRAVPQIPLPVPLLHMICTNVAGSPTPLYAAGRRMIASYPHVPTGYELGVNCAVQSYDGQLFCGFTADAGVVPDVGRLRDFMHAAFEELVRAISAKRRPRRAPGPALASAAAV